MSAERRAVWVLHGAVAGMIVWTHSRTPPDRLYRSRGGGWSRAMVFANYPTAIAAIATLPHARRRTAAALALPLCATTALPGVVDEGDLDGRWRNAPALIGIALACAAGERESQRSDGGDLRRLLVAVPLIAVSAPWLLAGLGLQTRGMRRPTPGELGVERVHIGHHEGLDGVLLALDALLLSRRRSGRWHRRLLALMLSYGAAVAAQDAWYEQVVKPGHAQRRLPDVIRPSASPAWAGLLASVPLVRRLVIG
jgi:hypothetical protein